MPTYSTTVKETLYQAALIAPAMGRVVYTVPDIMNALCNQQEFKDAVSKIYDAKKIGTFYEEVKKTMQVVGAPITTTGLTLKPDSNVVIVTKQLLEKTMLLTQKFFDDYEIRLSTLFVGLCINTEDLSYDKLFLDQGMSKDDIYYEMLKIELEEAGKPIVSKEELKIRDFFIEAGAKPLSKTRQLGTFISAAMAPKPRRELKMGSIDAGYLRDLLKEASSYTKPFIGREDVTERAMQVLCRCEKANPLLVGEPGVGKTAVTLGLAKRILNGEVPDSLKKCNFLELDLTRLAAGAGISGEYEMRVVNVFEDLKKIENPIIFIDELHTVFSSANTSAHDLGNILKPYLLDANFKIIGASTYKEYNKFIKKDPAFERRFMKIDVVEPSIEQAKVILNGLKKKYEEYHHVSYTQEALDEAVELSAKHIHGRYLPDKAIDLIDEAGAWKEVKTEEDKTITVEDIKDQLNKTCGIPVQALKNEKEIVRTLDSELKKKVFGQNEAVDKLSTMLKIAKAGLGDDEKPIASFLFVGPSGVGKTELAKSVAETLGIDFIRFDMSEFAEPHSVSKLFGAPAGYVGYDNGGLLTNEVQKKPHSVVLLDEIEKAHPEIFKSFLQVLDYGTMTDAQGNKTNFRNTIIIFTSNAGVADASRQCIGFGAGSNKSAIASAVNNTFSVEFRNRLSGIIEFNTLNSTVSVMIANKEFKKLQAKVEKQGYEMSVTDNCLKEIAKRGTSDEYGAREIGRVINGEVKQMISEKIIDGTLPKSFVINYSKEKFIIEKSLTSSGIIANTVKIDVPKEMSK